MPMAVKYSPLAAVETISTGSAKPKLFVVRFMDEREKKDTVGRMNNAYGGKVKTLVTTDDIGLILAEATTDALRKAGLEAELHSDRTSGQTIPSEERNGFDYVIGGRIKEVEVVTQPGWDTLRIKARIVVDILIAKGDQSEWIGPIEGAGERRDYIILQGSSLTESLDGAIQNCMRDMIRHHKASGTLQPEAKARK